MDDIVLWHNPRCTKSREALALLRAHGVEPTIVEYLKRPPSAPELDRVLFLLGLEPREFMRKEEDAWREADLDDPSLDRQTLITAMVAHPVLIQRPIAIHGNRAALGRPPERVLDLL
jgi:arsenate reductase